MTGVLDPLGLPRCWSCGNAYEYDRDDNGTCLWCGGPFDPPGDARAASEASD